MKKKPSRLRRARKARAKILSSGVHRLSIHRTPRHIYAQLFSPGQAVVVASASTIDTEVKKNVKGHSGNVTAASLVGKTIAERAKAAGISRVAFDRSGFKYHGRVKALAEAAREHGLEF